MKQVLLSLLLLTLLLSCKKDSDSVAPPPVPTTSDLIQGKWLFVDVKLQYYNDTGTLIEESYAQQAVNINFTNQQWILSSFPNGPVFETRDYRIEKNFNKNFIHTTNNSGEKVKYEITTLNKTRMEWIFLQTYEPGKNFFGRGQIPLSKYVETHFFEKD
jgi:hypothetical protein